MAIRRLLSSLQVRLLLLVLVTAVPGLALILYEDWQQRELATAAAKQNALRQAYEISLEHERLIQSGHYLLQTLVGLTSVRTHDSKQCNIIFSKMVKAHPASTELGAATPDGEVFCSSVPFTRPVNLANQPYFQQLLRSRDFAVSEFLVGPLSGKPNITIAYPAVDELGAVQAVAFIGLSLEWTNQFVAQLQLPQRSEVTVRDHNGLILARYPEPEKWIGRLAADTPVWKAMLTDQDGGTVEAAGLDNAKRLVAFTSVRGLGPGKKIYVSVGIPEEIVFSEAREASRRDFTLIAIVLAFSLIGVWFGAGQFITRPVNELVGATKRLAAGDLSARSGLPHGGGELHQLASSFDQMAQSLEQQIDERKQAEAEVQRNLERIRALHEIDRAITASLDLHAILAVLLQKIELVLPNAATTVRLLNKATGALEPVACCNLDEQEWKERGTIPPSRVISHRNEPWIIDDVQTDPQTGDRQFFRKHGLVSCLRILLAAEGNFLGEISFYTRGRHEFTRNEIEFLTTLAGQTALGIQNSQLYEQAKKQAQELTKIMAAMDHASRVKDQFLSVMSHELRTPLNVVLGYAAMLRDGMLGEIPANQKEVLSKVINRANDLLTLIRDILYATQIESRSVVVERQLVNLPDFLDRLRAAYYHSTERGITLNWNYSRDLPAVITDSEKLKKVLENLIHNGIKFTQRGTVTISARIRQQEPLTPHGSRLTPPCVEFKVSDTGIGIPTELLPVIFDKFAQVDSSETRLYGGVGLGLYIARQFTELLGGTIEVESEPGKGSTFTVTIPLEN